MTEPSTSSPRAVAGRYELGAVLGTGGMGTVWDAVDTRLGRPVAVKVLHAELAAQPRARRRFETEAHAAARLAHPNVVTLFDTGEDDGVPFIVMERLAGRTLADEIAAGRLALDRSLDVARQVLAALGAAHRAGIVHRDVKPSNVLLAERGEVKVGDFGIAKALDDLDLTRTTELLATPAFLAPERLAGRPASARSDLYSVGVLLYEAISGRRAFPGATPAATLLAIEAGRVEPLATQRPDVPPRVAAAVERAMARDPADRFASADEMAAAFADVPALEPTVPVRRADPEPTVPVAPAADATRTLARPAPPAAAPGPVERRHRPGRLVAIAAVVAAVVAIAVAGIRSSGGPSLPAGSTPATAPTPTSVAAPGPTLAPPLDGAIRRLEHAVGP